MTIIFKKKLLFSGEDVKQEVIALLTKQVVSGQGVEDARGPDEVAHGSGEGGGVNADGDEGVPDVDVSEETVVVLQEGAVGGERNQISTSTVQHAGFHWSTKCKSVSSFHPIQNGFKCIDNFDFESER